MSINHAVIQYHPCPYPLLFQWATDKPQVQTSHDACRPLIPPNELVKSKSKGGKSPRQSQKQSPTLVADTLGEPPDCSVAYVGLSHKKLEPLLFFSGSSGTLQDEALNTVMSLHPDNRSHDSGSHEQEGRLEVKESRPLLSRFNSFQTMAAVFSYCCTIPRRDYPRRARLSQKD